MAKKSGGERLARSVYEEELYRLQAELVKLQEWTRASGARIVVIFEGRDAAGKGGTIQRITQYLNPRFARIAALPAPTERESTEWYFQRYVERLPAAGEITLFDRSWYNRAGVEHVMGFCTKAEYARFLHQCPIFERLLVEDGILLRKYWFSVSDEEQQRRFHSRLDDPLRRWKLSPMDLESIARWEDYSRAKDDMFMMTDIPEAPWYVVESDDKRRARINMIAHLLSTVPYHKVKAPSLPLPPRPPSSGYVRTPREMQTYVPDHAASLTLRACAAGVRHTDAGEQRGTAAARRGAWRAGHVLGLARARDHGAGRDAGGDRRRARRRHAGRYHAAWSAGQAARQAACPDPRRASARAAFLGVHRPAVLAALPRLVGARGPARPRGLRRLVGAGPGRRLRADQPAARRRAAAAGQPVALPADEPPLDQPAVPSRRGHP